MSDLEAVPAGDVPAAATLSDDDYALVSVAGQSRRVKVDALRAAVSTGSIAEAVAAAEEARDAADAAIEATGVILDTSTLRARSIPILQGMDDAVLSDGAQAVVAEHVTGSGRGGGTFVLDRSSTAEPDGGTVFTTASGTGRWLRERAPGVFHCDWFGPGEADSTAAVRAAVDAAVAAGGGDVEFAGREYVIGGTISCYPGVTFRGTSGTRIKRKALSGPWHMFTLGAEGEDFRFRDITFDGNRNEQAAEDEASGLINFDSGSTSSVPNSKGFSATGCRFVNFSRGQHALHVKGFRNIHISDCYWEHGGRGLFHCIYLRRVSGVQVIGNNFGTGIESTLIKVQSIGNGGGAVVADNIGISGQRGTNISDFSLYTVTGNVFSGLTERGIAITQDENTGNELHGVIASNTIRDCGEYCLYIDNLWTGSITGNVFANAGKSLAYVRDARFLTFSGNSWQYNNVTGLLPDGAGGYVPAGDLDIKAIEITQGSIAPQLIHIEDKMVKMGTGVRNAVNSAIGLYTNVSGGNIHLHEDPAQLFSDFASNSRVQEANAAAVLYRTKMAADAAAPVAAAYIRSNYWVDEPVTWTVASGADHATLTSAFAAIDERQFVDGGRITLEMAAGYAPAGTVLINRRDYRRVKLTAEGGVVTVGAGFPASNYFLRVQDSIAPELACIVDMDGKGRNGIWLDGAEMAVLAGCGVINAGADGGVPADQTTGSNFVVQRLSRLSCRPDSGVGLIATGAAWRGVTVTWGSTASIVFADLSGCGTDPTQINHAGLWVSRASKVQADRATFAGSVRAIRASRGCEVSVREASMAGVPGNVISAAEGAQVLATDCDFTGSGIATQALLLLTSGEGNGGASLIDAQGAVFDDVTCKEIAWSVYDSGTIDISGSTGTGITGKVATAHVGTIRAGNSNLTLETGIADVSEMVFADAAAVVDLGGATLDGNGEATNIVRAIDWSRINMEAATLSGSTGRSITRTGQARVYTSGLTTDDGIAYPIEIGPPPAINSQTGTAYTLAFSDAGKVVESAAADPTTFTLPDDDTAGWEGAVMIELAQPGAGALTITAASGVTLNGISGGSGTISGRYGGARLQRRGANNWIITGSIGAVA